MKRYRVLIIPPWGKAVDVTDRVADLGTISESIEDSLLSLSHSDLSLDLNDEDGAMWELLRSADPDTRWTILVHRQTGKRRPKWERIFGGVLDLPWSVSRDRGEKTVDVDAFSFSKLFERVSAESVRRSFGVLTGSIAASSTALTLSSTTGLQRGDVVQLDNGDGTTEDFTIKQVLTGTTATTTVAAGNTFSAGSAALVLTPYYRDVAPATLVNALVAAAGFSANSISVSADVAAYPVPTPVSENGSRGFAQGRSLTIESNSITWIGIGSATVQVAFTPTSGWIQGGVVAAGHFDWTPYLTSEPGGIASVPSSGSAGRDIGYWVPRYPVVSARSYRPVKSTTFTVVDDLAATLATIDTSAGGYTHAYIEYDPVNDGFWSSYKRVDGTREALEFYAFAGGAQTDLDVGTGISGRLRCCRALNLMIVHTGSAFRVYNLTTKALISIIPTPAEAANLCMWSLRTFDGFITVTGQDADGRGSFVYVWTTAFVYMGRYELVPRRQGLGSGADALAIPFCVPRTLPDLKQVLMVDALGTMLVLSRRYDGVIPYADGDGSSCAALLAEIATVLLQTLDVSPYEVVRLAPRLAASDPIASLGAPLDTDGEAPIWEDYRTSFQVTGHDAHGVEIDYTAGRRGDSARKGERPVDIAITAGMAQTIAESANAFYSVKRREIQGTWPEGTRRIRPFDVVTFESRRWIALESELDLENEEQDLRLVEVA